MHENSNNKIFFNNAENWKEHSLKLCRVSKMRAFSIQFCNVGYNLGIQVTFCFSNPGHTLSLQKLLVNSSLPLLWFIAFCPSHSFTGQMHCNSFIFERNWTKMPCTMFVYSSVMESLCTTSLLFAQHHIYDMLFSRTMASRINELMLP